MADKEHWTAKQMIDALTESKGLISIAARKLGCSYNTVRNYIDNYPTVAAVLKEQRAAFVDIAELKLMGAVNSSQPWAVSLVLRTLGKDRGYVPSTEVTGKDGDPLAVALVEVIKPANHE